MKVNKESTGEDECESSPLIVKLISEPEKEEKRRIMKNVLIASFAFFLNFSAYVGLSRLQSSLHQRQGMGVITSSLTQFSVVIASLTLPNLVISYVKHKWAIPLGFSGYVLWIAANGYAQWETLTPASVMLGICSSFMWTSLNSYLSISATRYAALSKESVPSSTSLFFGIFYFIYNLSGITGALISSAIIPQPQSEIPVEALDLCGVNDCPWYNLTNPNEQPPDPIKLWTLVGIYMAIAFCGMLLVCLFLDNLPIALVQHENNKTRLLIATIKQLSNKKQLILIPISLYMGMAQAVFSAEYTKSFITCTLGMQKVGLVVTVFAVVNSAFCIITGRIIKQTGRVPVFTIGFITDVAVLVTLQTWKVDPNKECVLYIIAALWGAKDAVLIPQTNAFYGITFPQNVEAAYSNYKTFEATGFAVAFGASSFLCTSVKLYTLSGLLGMAAIGYYLVEYWNWLEGKL